MRDRAQRPGRAQNAPVKSVLLPVAILASLPLGAAHSAEPTRRVTVAGYIGDSMCGLRHGPLPKSSAEERECTLQCVSDGSRFILADRENRRIYQLDDQSAPRPFAGRKVRVTGKLDGDSLRVETIAAAD